MIGTPNDPHQIGPGAQFLDLSAYAVPAAHTFGNSGVGVVRGPGMARLDLSLASSSTSRSESTSSSAERLST